MQARAGTLRLVLCFYRGQTHARVAHACPPYSPRTQKLQLSPHFGVRVAAVATSLCAFAAYGLRGIVSLQLLLSLAAVATSLSEASQLLPRSPWLCSLRHGLLGRAAFATSLLGCAAFATSLVGLMLLPATTSPPQENSAPHLWSLYSRSRADGARPQLLPSTLAWSN